MHVWFSSIRFCVVGWFGVGTSTRNMVIMSALFVLRYRRWRGTHIRSRTNILAMLLGLSYCCMRFVLHVLGGIQMAMRTNAWFGESVCCCTRDVVRTVCWPLAGRSVLCSTRRSVGFCTFWMSFSKASFQRKNHTIICSVAIRQT